MNYTNLKSKLLTKISKASNLKHNNSKLVNNCDHNYKKYKQTITERSDKNNFEHSAHFVVLLCDKCKDKKIMDYIII